LLAANWVSPQTAAVTDVQPLFVGSDRSGVGVKLGLVALTVAVGAAACAVLP
jgi:hypothetical protein